MELRDIIVTPIVILLVYTGAYFFRPLVTDSITRRYFMWAFSVRIIGALALGFVYQFYYHGGDTYNFHTHGSRHIWEAFVDSPAKGIDLMFADGQHKGYFFRYSSQIFFFGDPSSFFIIRLAAIFDLFTFSAYSATAVLFGVVSFIGSWMLFLTFYKIYPALHRWIAIAVFFIPSAFFWGSGLMKDTITMACLSMATFEFYRLLFERKVSVLHIGVLLLSLYAVFAVKKFLLQAYLPAIIVWVYASNYKRIKPVALRFLLFPFLLTATISLAYFSIAKVGEGDSRYALDRLAQTSAITAIDIRYMTGSDAGSGYSLGELDGTFSSMVRLAPQAINVSLFRPYLWEVRNPLMVLSAFESLFLLVLTIYTFRQCGWRFFRYLRNPHVLFCIVFSIIVAFAVGVSTFNFGTLVRYKIPLLPFFIIGLAIIRYENKARKLAALESTE